METKFGARVDHSKFQPMDDTLPLKGACSWSCDPYKFWEIIDNISKMVHNRHNYNGRLMGNHV